MLKKHDQFTADGIILYGSCARGDNTTDSDIDILLLLSVAPEEIGEERNKIFDISDELDLKYDVVLAPVFQQVDYSKYRLDRAKEDLKAAQLLFST